MGVKIDVKLPAPALAVAAMLFVQLGAALSAHLFDVLTPAGTVWARLTVAGAILLAVTRPPIFRLPRRTLLTTIGLGVVTGMLTLMFIEAIARIPLGTAVAIEFLGPLTVAAIRSHRPSALIWPVLALIGVVGLTQPWVGNLDLLGVGFAGAASASWGGYILLTQKVGDQLPGLQGLAISLSTASLAVAPFGIAGAIHGLTVPVAVQAIGIAILAPLLPFVCEMQALRRMRVAAFGTLMAIEPGIAVMLGMVILGQKPDVVQAVGVIAVIVAGVGAQREPSQNSPTRSYRSLPVRNHKSRTHCPERFRGSRTKRHPTNCPPHDRSRTRYRAWRGHVSDVAARR